MSTSLTDDHEDGRGAHSFPPLQYGSRIGLVPFVGLSIASRAIEGDLKTAALHGLLAYGAVILSFLGGIHWGAAMIQSISRTDPGIDSVRLGISVIPSLVGWTSLLIDPRYGLALLSVGFAANLLLDIRSTRQGLSRHGIACFASPDDDRHHRPDRGGVRPVNTFVSPEADDCCDNERLACFCPTGHQFSLIRKFPSRPRKSLIPL